MRELSRFSLAATVIGTCALMAWGDGQIPDRATLDSILGGNQTLEDFESFNIASGGAVNLDVTSLDDQSIANGQGPGLVEDGATYVAGLLQWNGDAYFALPTKTFLANAETLDIVYDPAVTAMGVDAHAFSGYPYSGTMTVYDTSNSVVGTVSFTLNSGGAETVFVGWEWNAGISRVVFDDLAHSWGPVINDHGYGVGGSTYRCTVTGNCPGTVTVSWQNANPGRQQGIVFGANQGNTTIPNGVCQGTVLGVQGQVRLVNTIGTGNGAGSINGQAGTGACGGFIQLVEVPGCTTSTVGGPI